VAVAGDMIPISVERVLQQLAFQGIFINLLLAVFNLIPIPPLDGSHVMAKLLPDDLSRRYQAAGKYGFIALMALVFLVPGSFSVLLMPVDWLMGLADSFVRIWI